MIPPEAAGKAGSLILLTVKGDPIPLNDPPCMPFHGRHGGLSTAFPVKSNKENGKGTGLFLNIHDI